MNALNWNITNRVEYVLSFKARDKPEFTTLTGSGKASAPEAQASLLKIRQAYPKSHHWRILKRTTIEDVVWEDSFR